MRFDEFKKLGCKKFLSAMAFSLVMFQGTSIAEAARPDFSMCRGNGDGKVGFGLCRAAVASGCAADSEPVVHRHRHHRGHHSHERFCERVADVYERRTGMEPVWLASIEEVPPPVEEPAPEPVVDTTPVVLP